MASALAPDNAFLLGYFTRPHGIRGELRAHLEVQDLTPYLQLAAVYLPHPDGHLAPVTVERLRPDGENEVIVQLAGVASRDEAEALCGLSLYLPETLLPALEPGQFFYHQIIGYAVQDTAAGVIGVVQDVLESTGHDLIQVQHPAGHEILIPLVDEIVQQADHAARTLHVTLPEGLLELYLNEAPPPDDSDDADELGKLLPPGAKPVW